ncbi:MAG: hypothetical protein GY807_20445 [Gammaproteobacteria bacterium]|nr:hypothetical protein [Gammaproteobacteria bacterium]
MRAVDRTTEKFCETVREALPNYGIGVVRSNVPWGRSNYVYIHPLGGGSHIAKVRISDHPISMWRAVHGNESLLITAGASIESWSVWLGELVAVHTKEHNRIKRHKRLPLWAHEREKRKATGA